MTKNCITALVAGGMCALSLAVAPIASAAQTTPSCATVGSLTTLCQSDGSVSLYTSPEVGTYNQWAFWLGPGRHSHR